MAKLIKETIFKKFGRKLKIFEACDGRHYIQVISKNGHSYFEWLTDYDFKHAWTNLYLT